MRAPLVSLRNVSAGYDGKDVLSGISLDIYNGDFLGITGPNGGGKTTLMKVIMGLLPYSGTIGYSDNLTVNEIRRIGYLPQQNIFDRSFPISVIDVAVSGLQAEKRFLRRYTRKDFVRAHKLLEITGISALARRPIGELSGGQMQRALLCRALIARPRMLILDEPTTYLDSRFEDELYILLQELNCGIGKVEDRQKSSSKTDDTQIFGDKHDDKQGNEQSSKQSDEPDGRITIIMVSHDNDALSRATSNVVHVDGTILHRDNRPLTEEEAEEKLETSPRPTVSPTVEYRKI